ncbi:S8 family serine peptidase, partial [archaeon]|nr:S8 family serine peptidase [archaeon]
MINKINIQNMNVVLVLALLVIGSFVLFSNNDMINVDIQEIQSLTPQGEVPIVVTNGMTPQDKIADEVKEQLKEQNKVTVFLGANNDDDMDEIIKEVESMGGIVTASYETGNIIYAEIPSENVEKIAENSNIKTIQPTRKFHALLDVSIKQVGAPGAWVRGYTGLGVVVAVLDTGIDKNNPALVGKVIAEKNFITNSPMDYDGHGTHVAGIIAAENISGYGGVAPGVKLYNAKVLDDVGDGTTETILAGINWALNPDNDTATDDGADIISLSLGGEYSDPDDPVVIALKDAISKGVTVVISSGNCRSGGCGTFTGVTTPGNTKEAITVGAVDDYNNIAIFSSGEDILNVGIKPDVAAPGVNIMSLGLSNIYIEHSGTSMSAPHVTGAVAILLNKNPLLTPKNIKDILEKTAVDLGSIGKNIEFGSGLINLTKAVNPYLVSNQIINETMATGKSKLITIDITNYGAEDTIITGVDAPIWIENISYISSIPSVSTTQILFTINTNSIIPGNYTDLITINYANTLLEIPITLMVYLGDIPEINNMQFEKNILIGAMQNIIISTKNVDSIEGNITTPTNTIIPILFSRTLDVWSATFSTTQDIGVYNVSIKASDSEGKRLLKNEIFSVDYFVLHAKNQVSVDENTTLELEFMNLDNKSKDITVFFSINDSFGKTIKYLNSYKELDNFSTGILSTYWTPKIFGDYIIILEIKESNQTIELFEKNISVILPYIITIQNFTIIPSEIIKGENVTYIFDVKNNGSIDVNVTFEISMINEFGKTDALYVVSDELITKNSNSIVSYQTINNLQAGNYTTKARIIYGNRDIIYEKNITSNTKNMTEITNVIISNIMDLNTTEELSVTVFNGDVVPVESIVNIYFELDGINTIQITIGSGRINASNTHTFNANITTPEIAGLYTMFIILESEGNVIENTVLITIEDNIVPKISEFTYTDILSKNAPFIVSLDVFDHSNISFVNLSVIAPDNIEKIISLEKITEQTYRGAYTETSQLGNYSFTTIICDQYSNCITTNVNFFEVVDCVGAPILVVYTNYSVLIESFSTILSNDYCVSKWDKAVAGNLTLEYLNIFDAVVWSTGSTWGYSITKEDTELLENYTALGGRLLLEGDDILYNQGEIAEELTHSELLNDLSYATESVENKTNTTILITKTHPIVYGLSKNMTYNTVISEYPDSVLVTDGISLADWIDGGAALVIYNDILNTGSMVAYIPFDINAIDELNKNNLVKNIVDWLLTDNTNANVMVTNVTLVSDYIIENIMTGLEITLENKGLKDANTIVQLLVDDVEYETIDTNINLNSTKIITSNILLTPGIHTITFITNPIFLTKETIYTDNEYKKTILVAPQKPELFVAGINIDGNLLMNEDSNITIEFENRGGTNVSDVILDVYMDNVLLDTIVTNIDYGKARMTNIMWNVQKGEHLFKVIVDPQNNIDEFNETNNIFETKISGCSKSSIIVVYDDDGTTTATENLDSSKIYVSALSDANYCVTLWRESEKGTPTSEYINTFDMLVWSSGNFWNKSIDDDDVLVLSNVTINMLVEGSDIAFDHDNDTFVNETLGAVLNHDILLDNETQIIVNTTSEIMLGLPNITINESLSPYPDALIVTNSTEIASWTNSTSAIVVKDENIRTIFYAFTANAIENENVKEQLILQSIDWLVPPQPPATYFGYVYSKQGRIVNDGTIISAKINNIEYASVEIIQGMYSITIPGDILDTAEKEGGVDGEIIIISIDGSDTEPIIDWHVGVYEQNLTINRPPKISNETFVFAENSTVVISSAITDLDNDNLTINYGVPLDENGSWLTGFDDAGIYELEVNVSDGFLNITGTINVVVIDVNRPPTIEAIETVIVTELETVTIIANGTDLDGNQLIYSVNDTRFVVDGNSLSWKTQKGDLGNWTVSVIVSDGMLNDTTDVNVEVKDGAPIITILSPVNKIYDTKEIPFNWSSDEKLESAIISINGKNMSLLPTRPYAIESNVTNFEYAIDKDFGDTLTELNIQLNENILFKFNVVGDEVTLQSRHTLTTGFSQKCYNWSSNEYVAEYGGGRCPTQYSINKYHILNDCISENKTVYFRFVNTLNSCNFNVSDMYAIGFENITINAVEGLNNITIYGIDSFGNTNSTTVYFTVNTRQKINNYTIELNEGWNLISIPLILENNSIEYVLDSIKEKYDIVWGWNASRNMITNMNWILYVPEVPAMVSTLHELELNQGYWIFMTEKATFTISGWLAEENIIHLYPKWNLIGYPMLKTMPSKDFFMSVKNQTESVWGNYDETRESYGDYWQTYLPMVGVGSLTIMYPDMGYWVYVFDEKDVYLNYTDVVDERSPIITVLSPLNNSVIEQNITLIDIETNEKTRCNVTLEYNNLGLIRIYDKVSYRHTELIELQNNVDYRLNIFCEDVFENEANVSLNFGVFTESNTNENETI